MSLQSTQSPGVQKAANRGVRPRTIEAAPHWIVLTLAAVFAGGRRFGRPARRAAVALAGYQRGDL
jgi:hypothetical protein